MRWKPGLTRWAPSKTVFTASFLLFMQSAFQHILRRSPPCWQIKRQREVKFTVESKFKCQCTRCAAPKNVTSLRAHRWVILLPKTTLLEKCDNKGESLAQQHPIQQTLDLNLKHPASQVAIANLLAVRTFGPCCLFCDSWWSGDWISCTFRSSCWCCRCSKEI